MRHRTCLNDIKKRKKRAGLSLLAKKRIIGISTMILAGLLMAVPFFTRADGEPDVIASGSCGSGNITYSVARPNGETTNHNLTITINGTGIMDDYLETNANGVSSRKERPWESYLENTREVIIGGGIQHVGAYAFTMAVPTDRGNTTGITRITINPSGDPNQTLTIGERAFFNSSVTELSLPAKVTEIGKEGFAESPALTNVAFLFMEDTSGVRFHKIRGLGESAFANCTALTKLTSNKDPDPSVEGSIPDGPDAIPAGFLKNTKVTSVTIPIGVASIGEGAFENCKELKSVDFNDNSTRTTPLTTIEDSAFQNSGLTGELKLPSTITTIGKEAFAGVTGLNGDLTIPDSVDSIGEAAFSGCSGFNGTLHLPVAYDKKIEDYTFNGCSGLTGTVFIPVTVTEIGNRAFYGCSKVQGIEIEGQLNAIGIAAFAETTAATEITFKGNAAKDVYEATARNSEDNPINSFDETDIIVYPSGNQSFEDDKVHFVTENDITKWYGYRVKAVENGEIVYPDIMPVDKREVKIGEYKISVPNPDSIPDKGKGYKLILCEYAESEGAKTPDPLETAIRTGVSTITADTLFHSYDISLYNYRLYYNGGTPNATKVTGGVGSVEVILPLPNEIVTQVTADKTAKQLNNLKERLSLYTEADPSNTTTAYTEIADYTEVTNASIPTIQFTATHFSEFTLVYEPYIAPSLDPFVAVDLRAEENGGEGTQLYKGTANEGAPESSIIKITSPNHATGSFEEVTGKPNPTDGYRLEISYSDGAAIREAEWLATGRGVLLDSYRMLAPFKAELYKNCGRGYTREKVTEGFGSMSIQVPIPEEMDREKGTLQVLSLKTDTNNKSQIEVKTEANGGLNIGVVFGGTTAYAIFSTDHFSEFALYYVSNDAASDTSTTASTSSTEATTATGATTSSAAGGTTATGAGTSNAAAAGSTATGANTASTATTATTSSTLASGASVAASTGGSGATNRAGATTPVAVTTGSSGSASGSDMPTTGDSDFYRMTLSMALMLFGAYELISTIRIRKKGNR